MSTLKDRERIVILDFGGQYSQLIARRVRELGVFSSLHAHNTRAGELKALNPSGIILSGGPSSVNEEGAPRLDPEILELGLPVLGICYGMQLLIHLDAEGKVAPCDREYGRVELQIKEQGRLLEGIEDGFTAWMSHGDSVVKLPPGFKMLARSSKLEVAAVENQEENLYGVQFHPEVTHTQRGREVLKNFLFSICNLKGEWEVQDFIPEKIKSLKEELGEDNRALCALSGGIDSAVSAALVQEAIGDRLYCVFVNHGLLRKGEPEEVCNQLREGFGDNLIYVEAEDRFLSRLQGVVDPEKKRKIIGEEFIRVFEEEARKLGQLDYLVQGTIYSDIIESGTDTAATIKSHHNVGGLPEQLDFQLVEPLRDFFKDEVREIATRMGLPEEMVNRQPFPGPGLAIRILGEVNKEALDLLREADYIFNQELERSGLASEIWQSFAVLPTPIRSVGVQGDQRSYQHPIILRAVQSLDAMTASWVRIPDEVLERISERIVNEVEGINRVLYDLTTKPPATIEWE